jgi:hypothetical protein
MPKFANDRIKRKLNNIIQNVIIDIFPVFITINKSGLLLYI